MRLIALLALLAFNADAETVCNVTTRGILCPTTQPDTLPTVCLNGDMQIVPCGQLPTCRMTIQWTKTDSDHVSIVELTPECAGEADLAASQATTKILKLGR